MAKPKLDGRLDDAIWKAAKPVDLKSAAEDDERWPSQVMLAADREFLYLAVRCFKAPFFFGRMRTISHKALSMN